MNNTGLYSEFNSDLAPIFDSTIFGRTRMSLTPERWHEVKDAYRKGNYKYVIIGILHYVDNTLVSRRGNPEKTEFLIPHGHLMLDIKIQNGEFQVKAPFLQLPSENQLPLLRQITEINMRFLDFPEILLANNQLEFFYSNPLELCNPDTVYNVFHDICSCADTYGDVFIEDFNASWLHQPVIERFPQEDLNRALKRLSLYLKEANQYISWFESSRNYLGCLNILKITFMKIDYYLEPHGILRANLEKTIAYLKNGEVPYKERIKRGKDSLAEWQQMEDDRILKSLYRTETFMPRKSYLNENRLGLIFDPYYQQAHETLSSHRFVTAALTLLDAFFTLLHDYHCHQNLKDNITNVLMRASKKPWDIAADTLWEVMAGLIE